MIEAFVVFLCVFFNLLVPTFAWAEIPFFGRNLEQYGQMYCFKNEDLKGKLILDAGAGPSIFLAQLKEVGYLKEGSKAVDIEYGSMDSMRESIDKGMRRAFGPFYDGSYQNWPKEKQDRYRQSIQQHNDGHQAFLDYFQKYPEIYMQGDIRELPKLSLGGAKFDTIFSANLLFLYSRDDLNEDFHIKSILSMAEVLDERGDIRIFPLDDLSGNEPSFLPNLIKKLDEHGLIAQVTEGCTPSTGQIIKGQRALKGKVLKVKHKP